MAAGWNAQGRPWRGAPDPEETRLATQLVATLTTSLGDIEVELFPDQAPKTVANFVELAEGTREWTDPQTRSRRQSRLYDGTIFHRVIPGFMIQGGDPLGAADGDEELRPVGTRAGIRHSQQVRAGERQVRVDLVFELVARAAG